MMTFSISVVLSNFSFYDVLNFILSSSIVYLMFCMTECIVLICSRRNLPVNVYSHMMLPFLMNAMLFA